MKSLVAKTDNSDFCVICYFIFYLIKIIQLQFD